MADIAQNPTELAPVADQPSPSASPAPDGPALRAFPVEPDATGYLCHGFRYGRWEDAAAFARLLQSRPDLRAERGPHQARPVVVGPVGTEAQRLQALGVTWRGAQFHHGPYHYDRLEDAVAEAARERAAASPSPAT